MTNAGGEVTGYPDGDCRPGPRGSPADAQPRAGTAGAEAALAVRTGRGASAAVPPHLSRSQPSSTRRCHSEREGPAFRWFRFDPAHADQTADVVPRRSSSSCVWHDSAARHEAALLKRAVAVRLGRRSRRSTPRRRCPTPGAGSVFHG